MAGRRWERKRETGGRREEEEKGVGQDEEGEGREGRGGTGGGGADVLIRGWDERICQGSQGPLLLPLGDLPCPSEALPGVMRACDVRRASITEMSLF